jgi:hypothetical protein
MRYGGAGICARRSCHGEQSQIGALVYARFALLRAGLRRKEGPLFCVFTARLKPCPDTCIVDGCDLALQAGVGIVPTILIEDGDGQAR